MRRTICVEAFHFIFHNHDTLMFEWLLINLQLLFHSLIDLADEKDQRDIWATQHQTGVWLRDMYSFREDWRPGRLALICFTSAICGGLDAADLAQEDGYDQWLWRWSGEKEMERENHINAVKSEKGETKVVLLLIISRLLLIGSTMTVMMFFDDTNVSFIDWYLLP